MTNSVDQKKYELAIDLEDWSGNKRFARYKNFRVGPETDLYRLYFKSMYLGNAGDSLASHNGLPFSTFDVDNDNRDGKDFAERSCSRLYKVFYNKILICRFFKIYNKKHEHFITFREDGGMAIVMILTWTAGIWVDHIEASLME